MTDEEFIAHVCKGDADAVALVSLLHEVCHLWDDIHDGDKPASDAGMWAAMFDIPANRFYRRNFETLYPAMQMAALSWRVSEDMEAEANMEQRAIAHVARHSLVEVYILIAALCGGRRHAIACGPGLWERSVRNSAAEFFKEMEAKHEPV